MLPQPTLDLGPLARFLPPAALDRLVVTPVDAAELPHRARRLLDHQQDMTSTLERQMGEPLLLRVLAQVRSGDILTRQVVLVGANSGRAAELGAIVIHLDRFPEPARKDIVAGQRPLGALLATHHIPYSSRPRAFITLRADADVARSFGPGLRWGETLWGRTNVLETPEGACLARVIEILPSALAG